MSHLPHLFSTIRKAPSPRASSRRYMRTLYAAHTEPVYLVGAATGLLWLFYQTLKNRELDQWTEVAMVTLAMSVAIRLVQSAALAKLDYATIPTTPFNVFMIALLTIFTAVPTVIFMSTSGDFVAWAVASYALGAFFGSINFLVLYFRQIPRLSRDCDVPLELRIQALNSAVFVSMTLLLSSAAWAMFSQPPREPVFYAGIGASVALLWINVWHSGALTKYPKFLIQNDLPDSLSTALHLLPVKGAVTATVKMDPPLRTIRARRQDVARIAESLADEFEYVFTYIFGTADKQLLRRWLTVLLMAAGGLGEFGYLRFYMILDREKPEPVGFFRIDTSESLLLYDWVGRLLAALTLKLAGLGEMRAVLRRARVVERLQGTPQNEDLVLTYLVIFPEHRRQRYAAAFVRMLEIAQLWFDTNGVESRRIVLSVRQHNAVARHLFERAGYVNVEPATVEPVEDPLVASAGVGPLLRLERVVEEAQLTDAV